MKRWLGLALWGLALLLGAALLGRGMPPVLWQIITPQRLLETAVRLETGAARAPSAAQPAPLSAVTPEAVTCCTIWFTESAPNAALADAIT